jgi:hypothetical protein
MTLPQKFRKSPSASVQYSFTDWTQRVGKLRLYGVLGEDSSSTKYILTPDTLIFGSAKSTNRAQSAGSIQMDFEIAFTNPATISGLATAAFSFQGTSAASPGSDNFTVVVTAGLYHVSDSTTQLDSDISETTGTINGTETKYKQLLAEYDVGTVRIKAGDIIRLRVTMAPSGSSNSTSNGTLHHDPLNTDASSNTISTRLIVSLPFKLDI